MILEPVVGNSGFIAPKPEFLNAIRKITKEIGALLIFEKVIIRNTLARVGPSVSEAYGEIFKWGFYIIA